MSMSHYSKRSTSSSRQSDWFLYALLLAAVLCLPLVIQATEWFPAAGRLVWPVLWAMLLGIVLANSAAPGWLAWLISLILGAEYSVQFAGKLLPTADILLDDTVRAVSWVGQLTRGSLAPPWPYERSVTLIWDRSVAMIGNLVGWTEAVQAGAETRDITALMLGVCLVSWILVFNAAFTLLRSRKTFAGLFPLGAAVIANVSFTDIGMVYVQVYLGITLLALVRANLKRMERFWSRLGLDFSPELRRDATVAGGALSVVILVIALLVPYMTYNDAVWFFWDNLGPRFTAFYEDLDSAFAGRNPVPSPTPGRGRGLGAHNIGAEGLLGEDVVLVIQTSDPAPPPEEDLEMMGMDAAQFVAKRYWRERTYDEYTGHGWDVGNRETLEVEADEPWQMVDYPYTVLTQTVEVVAPNAGLIFAANEPVEVLDADYRVIARGPSDLAAIEVAGDTYTVVSYVPEPSEDQLQDAEGSYPVWVQERFLDLPRSVPQRVREEAERIVREAGATTRYEKARAIESFIRSYEYVLDLEPPSLDQDFVDYFLFDARKGYCDYSASAMVVMLRSLGVAARYASGYNMGVYDERLSGWVVYEANAHAWTEVYFPGYGWVEFEPTPTQYIFARSGSYTGSASLPETASVAETEQTLPPLWVWALGLALVVLFVVIWPPRYLRKQPAPRAAVQQTYERLVRRARWAGLAPFGGQTPREYLQALGREMERRAEFHGAAAGDVGVIEGVYLRARYSQGEISEDESLRVQGAWRRLRSSLLRLVFVRSPEATE